VPPYEMEICIRHLMAIPAWHAGTKRSPAVAATVIRKFLAYARQCVDENPTELNDGLSGNVFLSPVIVTGPN
jgi:hypothetical protein